MSVTQYGRKVNLTVNMKTGDSIVITDLRIVFTVKRGTTQTPNVAEVRVYNVSADTANGLVLNSDSLVLEAGYDGNYGIIFNGAIKQRRAGRLDQLDTYIDLTAVDGDHAYTFSTTTWAVASGATPADRIQQFVADMIPFGIKKDQSVDAVSGNGAIRGQTFYGLTRDELRILAKDQGYQWSLQDGQMVFIPNDAYLSGDVPILSPATGLIGVPEQTEEGVNFRVLLNPGIKIGTKVHIDNTTINQLGYGMNVLGQAQDAATRWFNKLSLSGDYYVLGIDYSGDTRGQEFYSDLKCLAVNADIPPGQVTNHVEPGSATAILDANFGTPSN